MSKLRWAQFFWADWRSDSALNLCSIPARGLWMELLCLAAQGEPYGTVTIKGRAPSDDELFDLTAPRGTRRREWDRWLAELERNRVAQRSPTRALYSPRMSHDGAISRARIKAAKASWKKPDQSRNPRNMHVQTQDHSPNLHEQTDCFADLESGTEVQSPPRSPPQGGRRGRSRSNGNGKEARNGFIDSAASDIQETIDHAEPERARGHRATVVPISRHLVGR